MKACVATGEKRKIECREIPAPAAAPGKLLLKTKYACICGSDLEYLDGSLALVSQGLTHVGAITGYKVAAELALDTLPDAVSLISQVFSIQPGSIPGHEFVAEVVEVGEGLTGWAVGDRVVPFLNPPGTTPPEDRTMGYETYRAWAEYMVVPPYSVQKVPDHVSDEEAVFAEPLSTGVGSVIGSGLQPGQSGVILGAGKIGLLVMMSARVYGASPVIVVDVVPSRLEKAKELGADAVINAGEVDAVAKWLNLPEMGPMRLLFVSGTARS